MKDNLTPERLRVLRLCNKPEGHRPLAEDWQAAYWLHERGLVSKRSVHRSSRYAITEAGKAKLALADTPVADDCPTCHGRREITVPVLPWAIQPDRKPAITSNGLRSIHTTTITCPDCRPRAPRRCITHLSHETPLV